MQLPDKANPEATVLLTGEDEKQPILISNNSSVFQIAAYAMLYSCYDASVFVE
jgi:hypothetical protein